MLSNLICLGQFLNTLGASKQVLKIFKTANRLSLDELNNRKSSFSQRIIALKLTVGLLLKLPRPGPEEISSLISNRKRKYGDEDNEGVCGSTSSSSLLYLRSALRLLARESKQRDKLAFIATASIALPEEGNTDNADGDSAVIVRKMASRLGQADSQRARARRRKAQAKIRRALFSGELSAYEASRRLASISMVEVSAADNLISLIESMDTRLAKELMAGAAGGMSTLYAWSTRGLARKRESLKTKKAVRSAVGLKPTAIEEGESMTQSSRKRLKMIHV